MTADDYWKEREGYQKDIRVLDILHERSYLEPVLEGLIKQAFLDGVQEGIARQANATLRKVE